MVSPAAFMVLFLGFIEKSSAEERERRVGDVVDMARFESWIDGQGKAFLRCAFGVRTSYFANQRLHGRLSVKGSRIVDRAVDFLGAKMFTKRVTFGRTNDELIVGVIGPQSSR